jgi:hypothetical protein
VGIGLKKEKDAELIALKNELLAMKNKKGTKPRGQAMSRDQHGEEPEQRSDL